MEHKFGEDTNDKMQKQISIRGLKIRRRYIFLEVDLSRSRSKPVRTILVKGIWSDHSIREDNWHISLIRELKDLILCCFTLQNTSWRYQLYFAFTVTIVILVIYSGKVFILLELYSTSRENDEEGRSPYLMIVICNLFIVCAGLVLVRSHDCAVAPYNTIM